ncbi:MAG: tRNA lysidine(34) synthetase TilS [Saprospiraceae bacterium]|nr:tRNA lysidine(34) synthetase TilS [Saprospiraceae bacterium]
MTGDKILLTVSGGMDSVVMCELFHQAGLKFGMAHCNFKLRGEESDGDARFVESLAKKYQVPLFIVEFETAKVAKELKISTQMAARDLRYEWFEKIRTENEYDFIATAHHQDDQVETFFINLLRGTGISGLHGILPKNGNIIRPLLFANRKEIVEFQQKYKLKFREDSSNAATKYLRNKIRHILLPAMEDIDADYANIFEANIQRFAEAEQIYNQQILKTRQELLIKKDTSVQIEIEKLKKLNPISTYLFELIKEFGFSFSACEDIIQSFNTDSGKQFYTETHRLLKDRDFLIIRKIKTEATKTYCIDEGTEKISEPVQLIFNSFYKKPDFKYSTDKNKACLDRSKLRFPLCIRKWEEGDYFYPLGSNFKKKLSDYFIDQKFSLFEKEDCWLLCSGDEMVWIIGYQMDNRFKITNKTREVIQIECVKK